MTPRHWLIIAALGLACLFGGWATWKIVSPVLADLRAVAKASRQEAVMAKETTRIVEKTLTHEVEIRERTQTAVEAVQEQPGAETPVPAELLSEWGRALDGLRSPAPTPDNHDPR